MSDHPEPKAPPPDFEPRSSVKIIVNAKGHRQWEVKVIAGQETPDAILAAAALARDIDREFVRQYGLGGKEPPQ